MKKMSWRKKKSLVWQLQLNSMARTKIAAHISLIDSREIVVWRISLHAHNSTTGVWNCCKDTAGRLWDELDQCSFPEWLNAFICTFQGMKLLLLQSQLNYGLNVNVQ